MRETFLSKHKTTLSQLVELYRKNRDTHALAKYFGVGSRTIRKALNRAGIYGKKGAYPGYKRKDHGQVEQWLQAHPGTSLPASWEEVRKLTGLPQNIVASYFIYRRRKMRTALKNLQITTDVTLLDTTGAEITFNDVRLYRVRGNYRTDEVIITAYLADRVAEIKTSLEQLREKGVIK